MGMKKVKNSLVVILSVVAVFVVGFMYFSNFGKKAEPEKTDRPFNPSANTPFSKPPTEASSEIVDQLKQFEIVKISYGMIDTSGSDWRFAWRLRLKSKADTALTLKARIRLRSEDKMVLQETLERGIILSAGQERTYSGPMTVPLPTARQVGGITIDVAF